MNDSAPDFQGTQGYVMEGGKIIIEDAADALLNHDHLLNAFLGLKKEAAI